MTQILSTEFDLFSQPAPVADAISFLGTDELLSASAYGGGGLTKTYGMRVWNYTESRFISWNSQDTSDPAGAYYPGPGSFGMPNTDDEAHIAWEEPDV